MTTTSSSFAPDLQAPTDPVCVAMRVTRYLLAGAAAYYLIAYAILALIRMNYGYELEWLEGACVDHVRRILEGQPLYVQPSVDFTPFCYTPLYWYVSAAVAKLVGLDFLALRLVSVLASFGVLLLIFQFVRRVTADSFWGLVAAGLYAATYHASGTWFDIARVDSLFLCLLLAAIYLLYFGQSTRTLLLAGVVLALAFLAKQTALIVALPLIGYAFLARRRGPAIAFTAACLGIVAVSTAAFNIATKQWYAYYVFRAPAHHDSLARMWTDYWTLDVARPLAIALALSLVAVLSRLAGDLRRHFAFFAALAIAMLGVSWLGRVHGAGYLNVLLPAYAFLAIGLALGCHALQSSWRNLASPGASPDNTPAGTSDAPQGATGSLPAGAAATETPPSPAIRHAALLLSLYAVALLQLALLAWWPSTRMPTEKEIRARQSQELNPRRTVRIPHEQDLLAGNSLLETIQAIGGDVWIPYHGHYTTLAGGPSFASAMAINDVLRGPDGPAKDAIKADIHRAITSRRFSAIILDDAWVFTKGTPEYNDLMANYDLKDVLFDDKTVFWPVTGWQTRPTVLCLRKPGAPQSQPSDTQP